MMSLVLCILFTVLLPCDLAVLVVKNAILTPSNEDSGNGATITRLGNGLSTVDTGDDQYWLLDSRTDIGFNLQLSLLIFERH